MSATKEETLNDFQAIADRVEDLSVVGAYFAEPVQASIAQSTKSRASRARAAGATAWSCPRWSGSGACAPRSTGGCSRRPWRPFPTGKSLALTTGNRLLLAADNARTVVTTAPLQ